VSGNEASHLTAPFAGPQGNAGALCRAKISPEVGVSIGSFIQASGRPWPSKGILSGVGELRRRGGGGNLGVRRTLPVRSGLMGPLVAGL
jgi:hypothetical protein